MNTSIPTASSDLATLVGAAPQSSAQLKGLMAGLKSKSASSDEAGFAGSDFASLLDSPGGGADQSPADSSAKTGGDAPACGVRNCRTILTVAISPVASVTLQIKGMVPEPVCTLAADPVSAATPPLVNPLPSVPVGETTSATPADVVTETPSGRPERAGEQAKTRPGLGRFLRSCGRHASEGLHSIFSKAPALSPMIPVATDPAFGEEIDSAPRRKDESLPVTPTSVPYHPSAALTAELSAEPAAGQGSQSAPLAEESVSAPAAEEVQAAPEILTAFVPTAPVTDPLAAAGTPVATTLPVATPPPVATTLPVGNATVDSNATVDLTGATVAPQPPAPVLPVDNAVSAQTETGSFRPETVAAPAEPAPVASPVAPAPATGLFDHAVLNRPAGRFFAHRPELLPAVENHLASGEVDTEAAEIAFRQSIPLSLKREIIESISAVLAPLLANVLSGTALAPTTPAAGTTTGGAVGQSTDRKTPLSATVMVRLGSQPPFKIELPLPVALLSGTHGQVPATPAVAADEGITPALESAPAAQAPLASPITVNPAPVAEALSVDVREVPPVWTGLGAAVAEKLPFDFPLPLKATIETAWNQAQPAGQTEQSELLAFIGEQVAALKNPPFGHEPKVTVTAADTEKADPIETPVALMIKVPGLGSIVAQVMTSNPAANAFAQKISLRPAAVEAKTAGEIRAARGEKKGNETTAERIFLNAGNQMLKSKATDAGIDVAKLEDTMPAQFTSRRVAVEQLELPSRITARDYLPAGFGSPAAAAPAEAPAVSTPTPVLAHRAVETIFNVVDAQRNGLSNATSVNLHFKFGGDDLAVRVQMRGGEVQTQFLTDSPDLRAALASEWQTLASQGVVSGLKLLDPVIMPASANVSTGFGSASQGQGHAQQQAQQQHHAEQAAAAFPELRTLRRAAAAATEPAPRAATAARANSQHLAALA